MIFSLEVRRARKGDCLLLHYGTPAKRGLALIDGGPSGVYVPHLKPRLQELRGALQLGAHQPLPIDLLMISHVDDDHLQGILELTGEMRNAPGAPKVKIKRLWHNSFDEVIGKNPEELQASTPFGEAATGREPRREVEEAAETDEEREIARASLDVLASIPQGHQLRRDAEKLGIPRNPEHGGKLILASGSEIDLPGGLSFIVAGPMQPELLALQEKHDKWLKDLKKKDLKPSDVLAAYVDPSVHNLSSVVVLAKVGTRTMLLTGDARGDKILEGLEEVGLLEANKSLHVGILKVPHHGSANNLATDFFERVTADHYVFSGNGEHGNPEREAFEMLVEARTGAKYKVHLTYPVDEIDTERKKDWKKEQAKAKAKGKTKPNWSDVKHSLAAFFDNAAIDSDDVAIVDETAAHIIDLEDPAGI